MRRLFVVVLVVLLNYPAARDAWRQHEIDTSGRPVTAAVVRTQHIGSGYFVGYRLPPASDPSQRAYAAVVTKAGYDAAQSGTITVRVVPGSPDLNAPVGQVQGGLFLGIAVVGDVLVAGLVVLAVRRRRRWKRRVVTEVAGDLATFEMAGLTLTARVSGPVVVGQLLRGDLVFLPASDVVLGDPPSRITHLDGANYLLVGSVRVAGSTYSELVLEHGFTVRVRGDAITHGARPKEWGQVTGEFVVSSS